MATRVCAPRRTGRWQEDFKTVIRRSIARPGREPNVSAMNWSTIAPAALASFLASMVEFVEALTIVLAVAATRGWKPSLLGAAAGLAALAVLVAAPGVSLASIPLPSLQLTVGVPLLLFGARWLQKAVLRSAGVIAMHDEAVAYSRQTQVLRSAAQIRSAFDPIAMLASFKAVVLEGVEVVFVVVALGLKRGLMVPAASGAGIALLLVIALGVVLHRPLARIPENTLKFAVGVMLTAFGTYWTGEGLGFAWPASDVSVLVLVAVFLVLAAVLVRVCSRARNVSTPRASRLAAVARPRRGALSSIGHALLSLLIDDLPLAIGISGWVGAMALMQALHPAGAALACGLLTAGLAAVLAISAWRRVAHAIELES